MKYDAHGNVVSYFLSCFQILQKIIYTKKIRIFFLKKQPGSSISDARRQARQSQSERSQGRQSADIGWRCRAASGAAGASERDEQNLRSRLAMCSFSLRGVFCLFLSVFK